MHGWMLSFPLSGGRASWVSALGLLVLVFTTIKIRPEARRKKTILGPSRAASCRESSTPVAMFLRSMLPRAAAQVARRTAFRVIPQRGMADVPVFPGPTGPDKRLVLAYSGGLDTSTQLRWLADKGYEVIAFCANLGQGGGMADEDFSGIEAKAIASGAKKCYVLDLQDDFVENYVFPIVRTPALRTRAAPAALSAPAASAVPDACLCAGACAPARSKGGMVTFERFRVCRSARMRSTSRDTSSALLLLVHASQRLWCVCIQECVWA